MQFKFSSRSPLNWLECTPAKGKLSKKNTKSSSISAKESYLLLLLGSGLFGVGGLGIILGSLRLLLVLLLASK